MLNQEQRYLRARKARAVRFGDDEAAAAIGKEFEISKLVVAMQRAGITVPDLETALDGAGER